MIVMPYLPIVIGALRVADNLLKVACAYEKDNPVLLEILSTLDRVIVVALKDLEEHAPGHKDPPEHHAMADTHGDDGPPEQAA